MAFERYPCSVRIRSLLNQVNALGLHLESRGGNLFVTPAENCTEEIVAALRQYKTEVMAALREHKHEHLDLLESKTSNLPAGNAPLLHVARQILEGEFEGVEQCTRKRLTVALRGIAHPLCRRALKQLQSKPSGGSSRSIANE